MPPDITWNKRNSAKQITPITLTKAGSGRCAVKKLLLVLIELLDRGVLILFNVPCKIIVAGCISSLPLTRMPVKCLFQDSCF